MTLRPIVQGERATLEINWVFAGVDPASILGATITAVMRDNRTKVVTAVTGVLTATAADTVEWDLSEGDSGTAGGYDVFLQAVVAGVATYTLIESLLIKEHPSATAVQNPLLVSISQTLATWLSNLWTAITGTATGQLVEVDADGLLADSGIAAADVSAALAVLDASEADDGDVLTAQSGSLVLLPPAEGGGDAITLAANDNLTLHDRIAALEASLFADVPPGTTVIQDEFTDTNGVALTSHVAAPTNTPGNSWQHLIGTFDIQSNKANVASLGGGLAMAVIDSGEADCIIRATMTYSTSSTGLVFRVASSTVYLQFVMGGNSYLIKRAPGLTILDSQTFSPSVGVDYDITITLRGDDITVDVNNGDISLSATDALNNTETKHGLFAQNVGNKWVDFVVETEGVTYTTLTAGTQSWYNTLQADQALTHVSTSFLASWIVYTDANELIVETYSNHVSNTNWMSIGYRINNGPAQALTPGASGAAEFTVGLGSGAKHKVEFLTGVKSGNAPGVGAWPVSVRPTNGTYCVDGSPTSVFSSAMVIYGDSIAVGDGATLPITEGFATLLRDALPEHPVAVEAWGYRSLHTDASTSGLIDAFVAKVAALNPAIIWMSIGTNDYGLEEWSAANFGTAYQAMLVDLIAAMPATKIYCMTPLHRTDESANTFGDTLQDYRDAIEAAVTAVATANVIFVDASAWLTTGDLADGIHPTTAGHAIVAAQIAAIVE